MPEPSRLPERLVGRVGCYKRKSIRGEQKNRPKTKGSEPKGKGGWAEAMYKADGPGPPPVLAKWETEKSCWEGRTETILSAVNGFLCKMHP